MSVISAGRFDTFERAERTAEELQEAGFTRDDISIVYIAPPGQHARTPIGGDAMNDRGSRAAPRGAGKGVVLGVVAGALIGGGIVWLVKAPLIVAVVGAAVGAWLGSLAGAMMHVRRAPRQHETVPDAPRQAGVLLALHASPDTETTAIAILQHSGAMIVEKASGEWRQGGWADFDPTREPSRVSSPS